MNKEKQLQALEQLRRAVQFITVDLTDEEAFNTIRISLGKDTTKEDCYEFVKILGECLEILKMVGGEENI